MKLLYVPRREQSVVVCADCLVEMARRRANSIDAIVTDPPYGLEFMGKEWDSFARQRPYKPRSEEGYGNKGVLTHYGRGGTSEQRETYRRRSNNAAQDWHHRWAVEALRVAKPGAHLLAFGGTRTFHRLACAVEDAGWEIRDTMGWLYGSGFPKSKNVALAIDKGEGMPDRGHRIAHASRVHPDGTPEPPGEQLPPYEAKTEKGKPWEGWGTALKPSFEIIVVARKPLDGTVAANVLKWGVGGLNIDGCRVGTEDHFGGGAKMSSSGQTIGVHGSYEGDGFKNGPALGRWPANLIHDGSDEVLARFPQTASGNLGPHHGAGGLPRKFAGDFRQGTCVDREYGGDSGSASRFFYCAKASRSERGEGNDHPTVKPLALMRYLVRLVTPPNGLVLDPFAGSGTTGVAAVREGFRCCLIEQNEKYAMYARRRLGEMSG